MNYYYYYFGSDYFSMCARDTWLTGTMADYTHSVAAGGSFVFNFFVFSLHANKSSAFTRQTRCMLLFKFTVTVGSVSDRFTSLRFTEVQY